MVSFDEIEISGVKGLKHLKLSGLKKINYVVGPSGAGKSTIFEVLTLLLRNNFSRQLKTMGKYNFVIPGEALINLRTKENNRISNFSYSIRASSESSLSISEKSGNNLKHKINIEYFSTEQKVNNYNDSLKRQLNRYDPTKQNNTIKSVLNNTKISDMGNFAPFSVVRVHRGDSDEEPMVLVGREREEEMSTSNLAGGHTSLLMLLTCIEHNSRDNILIIEEPETGMHVEQQKTIHGWIKDAVSDISNTQIFVITHSPFLLTSIEENDNDTNVYLIKEGSAVKEEGYSAKGARYLAAQIVGIGFGDLIPEKVVVSEGSLSCLLQIINDRFYNKSIFFTAAISKMGNEASGDQDITKLADIQNIYNNRFNFYDGVSLLFITDDPNDKKTKSLVDKIKARDTDIVTLKKKAIEDYYPDLNIEKGVLENVLDDKISKNSRAKIVGKSITKDDFEKVFHELVNTVFG